MRCCLYRLRVSLLLRGYHAHALVLFLVLFRRASARTHTLPDFRLVGSYFAFCTPFTYVRFVYRRCRCGLRLRTRLRSPVPLSAGYSYAFPPFVTALRLHQHHHARRTPPPTAHLPQFVLLPGFTCQFTTYGCSPLLPNLYLSPLYIRCRLRIFYCTHFLPLPAGLLPPPHYPPTTFPKFTHAHTIARTGVLPRVPRTLPAHAHFTIPPHARSFAFVPRTPRRWHWRLPRCTRTLVLWFTFTTHTTTLPCTHTHARRFYYPHHTTAPYITTLPRWLVPHHVLRFPFTFVARTGSFTYHHTLRLPLPFLPPCPTHTGSPLLPYVVFVVLVGSLVPVGSVR